MLQNDIDEFTHGYKVAALWSSTDMDSDEPLDQLDPEPEWSEEALKKIKEDCEKFCEEQESDLIDYMLERVYDPSHGPVIGHAGHDFWLTRCGHGVGFWDRDLDELGDRLTEACEPYGNLDPYVGDDGLLYLA